MIPAFADEPSESSGEVVTEAPGTSAANTTVDFLKGSGTEADPYRISCADDLMKLASFVNDGNAAEYDTHNDNVGNFHGYFFEQTADIDLNGKNWEPIGFSGGEGKYFAATYDGNGHTIANATSIGKKDTEGYATAGIFGWVVHGSVTNLRVKNANFSATGELHYGYAGGICSVAYGTTISNCSVVSSHIDAKRTDDNTTAAGGVVGYSSGGQFYNCSSTANTVTTTCYGGGFAGEIDNDYAGDSYFENCYVVAGNVEPTLADRSVRVGGFVGEVTDDTLIAKNCYVFNEKIAVDSTTVAAGTTIGVFAGNLWSDYSTLDLTNCYFGECGNVATNTGTAAVKSNEEFKNGTVANELGDAFIQGANYPILRSEPADYSNVDAAIEKANNLNQNDYEDFSKVTKAINAVIRGKTVVEQSEVDDMAKAINDAISTLQKKTPVTPMEPEAPTTPEEPSEPTRPVRPPYRPSSSSSSSFSNRTSDTSLAPTEEKPDRNPFSDVKKGSFYYDAVQWAVKKGITVGTSKTTFGPNDQCKRAQMVTFLWRMAGSPDIKGEMPFTDVKEDSYYYKAVLWAYQNGITSGTSKTAFSPYADCSRGQMAVFLHRMSKEKYDAKNSGFEDVKNDAYYAASVAWLKKSGITTGTSDMTFSPNDSCKRGQMVTFLYRYSQKKK